MTVRKILRQIYPICFVIYPLLALYATNSNYVNFSDTARFLVFGLVGLVLIWLLLRLVSRSWLKAGVLASLLAVMFFSYGHVYLLAVERFGEGFSHRYLLLAYLVVALVLGGLVLWKLRADSQLPGFLGVVGVVLVAMTLVQIGWYELQLLRSSQAANSIQADSDIELSSSPDVYLVILDAHTRSDTLLKDYGLDNSEFVSALEELGFYVAACSQSNYPITDLALQSLFNMDYVDQFIAEDAVLPGLKSSTVKQTFDSAGYTTIAFDNYFSSHYDLDEDLRVRRKVSATERVSVLTGLNEYEALVVETSAGRLLVDFQHVLSRYFGEAFSDEEQYYSHYLETLFILDELSGLPSGEGRKFVFAHIATPHWPFVFSEDGEYEHIWGLEDKEGYRKNVAFIDSQIPGVMEEIISRSDSPPVIILMGDHGPTGEGVPIESRITNLYAVYADEDVLAQLEPTTTPVNTFRLIFNYYFGTAYAPLEDISYRIWNNEAYDLDAVVPNTCIEN